MTRSWKSGLTALAAGFAAVAGTLATAGPAQAATPFGSIDSAVVSQFALDPVADFGGQRQNTFDVYDEAIKAVEAKGAVARTNATSVLTSGGRTGINGLCHGTGLSAGLSPSGFCWDKADDTSNSYTDAGGWTPQGLTGSYDAQPGGLVDGHKAFLASWHFSRGLGGANPVANEFARVSLVNADNSKITYNHLLLVEPTGTQAGGDGNYRAVQGTHADGVVWYGNKVFVANGRWLQVYDLQHIWKVNSSQESVGINGTTSSARWSSYALPMVGRYRTTADDNTACVVATGTSPCLNSLSLDRTGQDGLVSAEYKPGGAGGRVVRWPLNYLTALPTTTDPSGHGVSHATVGYSSPVWAMQGAATNGQYWYMSGTCPTGTGGGSGDAIDYSCIHRALPDDAPHVYTTSPVLTQNLGYSPDTGRIWGINERINSTTGIRVVFSING
ncbi:hypothetical protein [Streptomyces melanogenes]|uniref:Secreted protein n=1 Tax=Streptomyces melanogenes TaxID=67326 RepID=A0ABZ1XSR2_9ACTN|nr:hypothetical protein [Streptomyces melanogenes]